MDDTEEPKSADQQLLELVRASPGISAPRLTRKLGVSLRTTKRIIARVREAGLLEFRGASKTGRYYCIDDREPE